VADDSENRIQARLFDLMLSLTTEDGFNVRAHAFAVPNGMQIAGGPKSRGKYMNAMKERGLTPGVSDVVLALPRGPYHGAYLELKRDKSSAVSEEQLQFRERMERQGYYAVIACGWDETIGHLSRYLGFGAPGK
jgi:hypothetical protein